MTKTPRPLDPLRFPLSGRSLIEASAGTGKTFTIAMLYVRLVLGHSGLRDDETEGLDSLNRSPLTPPEILVVTFTDAATKELRDRIRARLTEAAAYFQMSPDEVEWIAPGKDLLNDLRADYPEDEWLGCARKLQLAAEWMDEAAVSTIHGWCNRMLREHAFDSDSLFTQSLETDQTELLADVVRDYWRTFMAPLDTSLAARVAKWFGDPAELQAGIRNLLEYADQLDEGDKPSEAIALAREEAARRRAALKAPWIEWADAIEQLLDTMRDAGQFGPRRMTKAQCTTWLNALRSWATDQAADKPALSDLAWERLSPEGLAQECVQGAMPPQEALEPLSALAKLRGELDALPDGRESVLCHAVRWVAKRFADEQGRRSQMGFNELLTRLDAALHGPNGARLADVIRHQFPVALIDEFQDTDPVQYRIFDTVYKNNDQNNDQSTATALIMIGDPKQAIYAFRGADIRTYLAARVASGDQLYTLTRNFRSTDAMVEATNFCFGLAEQRDDGAGAFMFRSAEGNPVPFVDVDAKGRDDAFVVDGAEPRALTAWWLGGEKADGSITKGLYLERMSASCASEIVRLLNKGQAGDAGFQSEDGFRSLRPADMAVLVNNRSEADAIRDALARRGVRSVYLSDKDSVFTSGPAAEVQHWLAACADPDDGRLVRTALATRTLGLDWNELETLRRDELAWETCVLRFREYRECWRRQGVLPMLRRVLNDYGVPARLLAIPGGERTLTDVLHLAELLQQASTLIEGEHGLIRYLAEQRQAAESDGGTGGDSPQIRLESDGDLVKVVTVHKSKGLEYPLVFLPFACTFRETSADDVPLKWHDENGQLRIALSGTQQTVALADRERLGEDLRKLYVALTRACYATWIGFAPLKAFERSAWGYLLGGGREIPLPGLDTELGTQFGPCTQIAVAEAPEASHERFIERRVDRQEGAARTSVRVIREPWWIASYSSLKTASDGHAIVADTPDQDNFIELLGAETERDDDGYDAAISATQSATQSERLGATQGEAQDAAQGTAAEPSLTDGTIHAFPKGSDPGSFLHDLLEWTANEGFGNVARNPAALRDVVARRCNVRGWERWIDPLTAWVMRLISTPLTIGDVNGMEPASFALAELDTSIAEMEFWVAAHTVDTERVDKAVCRYTLDGASRPALEPATLNGMLKGFMDLVFEHDGRYYVADYKSNWLGADDRAYTSERMRAQILHSRYELQYVLYLFALHRLLKARLPDYDYDEHIGGAVYLFVRGIGAPSQGMHVERPPRELIETLDALFESGSDATTRDAVFA